VIPGRSHWFSSCGAVRLSYSRGGQENNVLDKEGSVKVGDFFGEDFVLWFNIPFGIEWSPVSSHVSVEILQILFDSVLMSEECCELGECPWAWCSGRDIMAIEIVNVVTTTKSSFDLAS
jgi:hypothetical protein